MVVSSIMSILWVTNFGRVVRREWKRIVSRPIYLVITVLLPLLAIFVPRMIFQEGVSRHLPIAVCDLDHSTLSRHVIRSLDGDPFLQIQSQVPDIALGQKLLLSGKIYALVVFPENLERDIRLKRSPKIASYYNNQLFSVAGIVVREIQGVISAESESLKVLFYESQGQQRAAAKIQGNPVQIDTHTLFNPYLNYNVFLATPLGPAMLQVVVMMTTIFVIGLELKNGTSMEWLATAKGSFSATLLGKLTPYTLIFLFVGFVFNLWLFFCAGIPQQGSFLFLLYQFSEEISK